MINKTSTSIDYFEVPNQDVQFLEFEIQNVTKFNTLICNPQCLFHLEKLKNVRLKC